MNNEKLLKSTLKEKIAYGVSGWGANLVWTFMLCYLTMYYTDSVGVSAAAVGTIMLLARLLDGVSDVIGAILIDKCHMRMGKIKPWFVIAGPLMTIGQICVFHVPASLSEQGKLVYIFITYTFVAAVAYTLYNLAIASILPLMSMDPADRNKASSISMFITNAGVMVMTLATPVLLVKWGGVNSQSSWGRIATIYSILSGVFIVAFGLIVKERCLPESETEKAVDAVKKKEKKSTVKSIKTVLSSKYSWFLVVFFICFYMSSGMAGINVYFFKDVVGNFNLYGVASSVLTIATLVTILMMPVCLGKWGNFKTLLIGGIIFMAGSVLLYVGTHSVPMIFVAFALKGIGTAPMSCLMFVYIAELADYFAVQKNLRVEEYSSMVSSVGTKVGSGLGSAIVGWGLSWCGYNYVAEVQSQGVMQGVTLITALVPAALVIILLVCMKFWNVGSKD